MHPHQVGDAVAGVPGHCNHAAGNRAQREALVIGKQMVELRAIGTKPGRQCVLRRQRLLDLCDAFADPDSRVRPVLLQPLRGAEVIGVCVRFQQPLHLPAMLLYGIDNGLRRLCGDRAGVGSVVQRRVDHRRRPGARIGNHVGKGVAVGMEERKDLRLHRYLRLRGCAAPH